ncbi:MAG TPA: glucose-6-phosphate dehydrogenase assembly protein OpcA [Solirubrobacteraceae bacterium]|nr:glucose-6-phosphate dehydrogenase assembly protein OpcA [Solirubrobacteraceae bacterium]
MSEDVWHERDTTPSAIEAALRGLLARRYQQDRAFVPARVMNLVVIVERAFRGEVENRLARVGRYHPSRLIVASVEEKRTELDARATVAAEDTVHKPGHIAVGRERVEVEIGPQQLEGLDTIVDPLLVSDLATMVWAPHGHRAGVDALRRLASIVLIDSLDEPDLREAFERAADLTGSAYVVDLAWLRSTPWRERVAASFDPPAMRGALGAIDKVVVRHRPDSTAAAVLFCGWLASRLGWRPSALSHRRDQLTGHCRARRGEIALELRPQEMGAPGLGGVTIEMASGEAVSLDRGPGGLRAVRRARDGGEQTWTVLGASRGESGILGEGVRQALLRDPTYKPALEAGRALVG